MKPQTRYTKSGNINIAFQTFGSGPMDIVYVPGWVSNIDLMWDCPELVDFLLSLGELARVILFDKRGTGLSDRVVEFSNLEERMDDIRAVMDEVGSQKAVLFGHSEGGSASALFAATYPERTIALVTFGIFAKRQYSEDYPWAPTDEQRQVVYDMIENSWGSGNMNLETLAPSKANDPVFMNWLSNYFRSGASPSAALVLTKMNTAVDIINILHTIKIPTLILQRKEDIDVKIEEGKFIADRIEQAKFVELEGNDHMFWIGNTQIILDHIGNFLNDLKQDKTPESRLFTVLSGKFKVKPEDSRSQDLIAQLLQKGGGKHVQFTKGKFLSTFDGPSKAVQIGLGLVEFLRSLGEEISVMVDMREGIYLDNDRIHIKEQAIIDSILAETPFQKTITSEAVKNLSSGVDLQFDGFKHQRDEAIGSYELLYYVSDQNNSESKSKAEQRVIKSTFLDNVLEIIGNQFPDESFSIEPLCTAVRISERQLQRKIKSLTNKSPNQLILSVRLQKAKTMLQRGDQNVSEVAYSCGFSNPSYFSKCFKKEFGCNPTVYIPV